MATRHSAVLTVPNALSVLRIVLVVIFCYLTLADRSFVGAFVVIAVAGITDFLDGFIARRWSQTSRLGELLDPLADRFTALAVPLVLWIAGFVPWWLVVILLVRDLVMAIALIQLRSRGQLGVPVHFLGKAATFTLLCGLPLLLFSQSTNTAALIASGLGWALTLWGAALYWWSAWVYLGQVRRIVGNSAQAVAQP